MSGPHPACLPRPARCARLDGCLGLLEPGRPPRTRHGNTPQDPLRSLTRTRMMRFPVRNAGSSPAAMRRRSVWTLKPRMSAAARSEMSDLIALSIGEEGHLTCVSGPSGPHSRTTQPGGSPSRTRRSGRS